MNKKDKLNMHTSNLADENFKTLVKMFPNAVTETIDENGEVIRAIDSDVLAQEINTHVVSGKEERYQFTWPDKKKSVLLANSPISATLRPCKEESVNFDDTENLYIEGDNLDVLKLLQETYLNRVKMIYIDPPYNTGNNLIYRNNYIQKANDYLKNSGQLDSDGNNIVANRESNGRFHTDWLNMMYPRLRLARNLLSEDGYIVMAIDDNEVYNFKKISDEVFGNANFIGTIVTRCNPQGRGKNNIDPNHEYHLVYSKNFTKMPLLKIEKDNEETVYRYLIRSGTNSRKNERPNRYYPMLEKNGVISVIKKDEYKKIYSKEKGFDEKFINDLQKKYEDLGYQFILPKSKDGEEKVWQRIYERVSLECENYIYENGHIKIPAESDRTPPSLWMDEKYSNVSYGTTNLKNLFGMEKIPFDYSKSLYTVKDLISLNTNNEDIILDFFSGSATTAHAVMKLNSEDECKRKYIMVQIPELTDEKSEAYKAGYKNICEIGKERIRHAGAKIKEENKDKEGIENLDTGFRVLKLSSSNMKEVYYTPEEYSQMDFNLQGFIDNIKPDRTDEDLLFQVMLDLGIPLSAKISQEGNIFNVNDNYLIACFDKVDTNMITEIAQKQPYYAIFRDSSFINDSALVNVEQIFNTYSPSTIRRVL
jgi:adenine-specific DNA-methyltransferase